MLKNQTVAVGKAYVNEREGLVREVIEEVDQRRIRFNEFDWHSGRLIPAPFRICHKSQLSRWADREARALDLARIHPFERPPETEGSIPGQATNAEFELRKAGVEQVVGSNTLHRW